MLEDMAHQTKAIQRDIQARQKRNADLKRIERKFQEFESATKAGNRNCRFLQVMEALPTRVQHVSEINQKPVMLQLQIAISTLLIENRDSNVSSSADSIHRHLLDVSMRLDTNVTSPSAHGDTARACK